MGKPKQLACFQILALLGFFNISYCAQTSKEESVRLNLGDITKQYKLMENEVKYFNININPMEFNGDEDLVIKVQSVDQYGDPDLYISKNNQKPNSADSSQWMCATYGKDICSINSKNLTSGQNIYLGVKCLYSCRFTLLASLTKQIQLVDGIERQFEFKAMETKLFKFKVPAVAGLKDDQNKVNSVIINAAPLLPQADNIMLAASTQADVIPTSGSRKGVPGWMKGQTLRVSDQGDDWCTDCEITIMVDVTDPGLYYVSAKTNVGVAMLYQDRQVDDVAFYGENVCYRYYVQNNENDVVFRIKQYSGLISFTLNPNKTAREYEDGAIKRVSAQNSAIVLTPKIREQHKQMKGAWFLCVQTHMTSTFSILVSEKSNSLTYSYLEDSYEENVIVKGAEIKRFMYKVPALDYLGEDIKIEIRLTLQSGKTPQMAAAFCQEKDDHTKCAKNLTLDQIIGSKATFQKANILGQDLVLSIDHDERTCQNVYDGECYYTIAIIGQSEPEEITSCQIKIIHSQLNHYILSEGTMITDYVNLGTYRFYSFTLLPDVSVKNVTFKLNTLHGDADIYVSRTMTFPNKIDYEKSSVRTNSAIDEVHFDGENITTTYYIGVYSFQYSTYNLVVKVDRGRSDNSGPQLIEGVPYRGSIHNEDSFESYSFQVKMMKDYEKSIKIQISPIQKRVHFYVNWGKPATNTDYMWYSDSNTLEIATKDKHFQSQGTYYITVYPKYLIWDRLTDDYYTYMIMYSTMDSYVYLQSQTAQEYQQKSGQNQYFRHFITRANSDISVSMTVFNGNPNMFISTNPRNKLPTEDKNDLNSKGQSLLSGSKGKALYISANQLTKSSTSCKNYANTLNSEQEPCAIFINVICSEDCKYSLKLQYEKEGPQNIVVGVPQHDIVKEGSFNYYYLNVRDGKTDEIFSVLNSLSGNTDLYVRFQDNPQNLFPEQWIKPDSSNYDLKSAKLLDQDIVKITKTDLSDCFKRFQLKEGNQQRECTIIFGVYSPRQSALQNENEDFSVRYNFVVYTDIIQLMNGAPINGQVDEHEYQYYIFEAICDDCPIIISLSTVGSGDPDLYINFGDQNLPNKYNYDLSSSTLRSEMVLIDLNNYAIQNKRISSLKMPFTIGVYGTKKSTFTISVTQEKNPITVLGAGQSLKRVQEAYDTTYFMYYHISDDKDFKVQFNLRQGDIDVYMRTFDENEENQNLAQRMPKSKRDAQWSLSNVASTSATEKKEMLVLNQEINFCSMCYYIIGVFTKEVKSEYTIMVNSLDANYNNSLLLKIGEQYHFTIKENQEQILRFIIDERSAIQIIQTVNSGYISIFLKQNLDDERNIDEIHHTANLNLDVGSSDFHVERIYYLVVKGVRDSDFSLQVTQVRMITQLTDGIPIKLQYFGLEDLSKPMIFHLPDGDQTVDIQVKNKGQSLSFPRLYVKYYDDIETEQSTLEFPPGGPSNYDQQTFWDYKFGVLQFQKTYSGVKGGKAGLAINLHSPKNQIQGGSFQVTVTSSSVMMIQAETSYLGSLNHANSYMIYKVDDNLIHSSGYLMIEFVQCMGDADIIFIDDLQRRKPLNIERNERKEFGRQYMFIQLPIDNLNIMIRPNKDKTDEDMSGFSTDYYIKIRQSPTIQKRNIDYHFQTDNKISVNKLGSDSVNLTWNNLYYSDSMGGIRKTNSIYNVIAVNDSRVRLDTICWINPERNQTHKYIFTNSTSTLLERLEPGTTYYVNVIAQFKVDFQEEYEIVPYEKIEIHMAVKKFSYIQIAVSAILALILIGGGYYLLKKCNNQEKPYYKPKAYMEYEMTNVSASSGNTGRYETPAAILGGKADDETSILNSTSGSNGVNDSQIRGL